MKEFMKQKYIILYCRQLWAFIGIQPKVLVGYPPQTASSPLPQVEKVAKHTGY